MKTQCPNCKARFNVDDKFAGKQAKCPKCTRPFTIEPFTEAPEAPTKSSAPAVAAAPVKKPQPLPAETPAKSAEPVTPPAKIPPQASPPVKKPEQMPAPAKIAEPVKPAATISRPAEAPVAKIIEPAKETKPASKPVSKTTLSKIIFVYCWMAVRIIAGVLAGLGLMMAVKREAHSTLIATFSTADVFLVLSVLIELLLFYKMWAAIKDSHTSITPGKAVGFLFIPVFNFYWALCMVIGFAEDYNSFIQRRSIKAGNLPMWLFMVYAFALMLSILFVTTPMMGVFAILGRIGGAFAGYPAASWAIFFFVSAVGIGHFITYVLMSIKTCNAVNVLPAR